MVWSPSTTWVFLYSLLFPHPSLKFTAGLLFNRLIPQDGLAWSSSPSVCIGHCVHFLRGLQLFTMSRQEGGKRDRLPGWGRSSQQERQLGQLGQEKRGEETRYRSYSQDKRAPPANAHEFHEFQGTLSKEIFKDISFALMFEFARIIPTLGNIWNTI